MPHLHISILSVLCLAVAAHAQAPGVSKIDPPNWYAALPKPMLLLRGENLSGATIRISDSALVVEKMVVSANGHYAQVWLSASPAQAEAVSIEIVNATGKLSVPYTFAARRAPNDGMAGFSQADVMYMVVTDRFADGNAANDGPNARSLATSPEAAAERARLRGWHGGDLRGIEQHIPYLQQLGVTTVWPTPVYQNLGSESFHGYHATDYYAVDEHFGSMADLQSLARALHAHGMKLVLDIVPNHVGPLHPWVQDEPAPDWFHGTLAQHVAGETDFTALIDPHASPASRVSTLDGWFVDALPDMNTDAPAVAQYERQNAVWWIEETGADGFRIDTFPYVDRPFWHAFMGELHELYPRLTEVGEVSTDEPETNAAFAAGVTRAGVDTQLYTPFDYPFYHALRAVFAGNAPFTRITRVLAADELYPHPEHLVTFLGNHDQSRLAEDVKDPALRAVAYALLLTTRGTPQLYYGDELAMTGANDPNNRDNFAGGLLPGAPAASRTAAQQTEFAMVQRLLALRKAHPALQTGEEQVLTSSADTLVYLRTSPAEQILVALNKSQSAKTLKVPLAGTAASAMHQTSPLLGEQSSATIEGGQLTLTLAPASAIISRLH